MKKSVFICASLMLLSFAGGYILGQTPQRDTFEILAPDRPDAQPVEASGGSLQAVKGKININTANMAELADLPGVGEAIAKRIIEYREQNGGFEEIAEITEVSGIGEKTFEKMRDYITIEDSAG